MFRVLFNSLRLPFQTLGFEGGSQSPLVHLRLLPSSSLPFSLLSMPKRLHERNFVPIESSDPLSVANYPQLIMSNSRFILPIHMLDNSRRDHLQHIIIKCLAGTRNELRDGHRSREYLTQSHF